MRMFCSSEKPYYTVICNSEKDHHEPNEILVNDQRDLEILLLCLGDQVKLTNSEQDIFQLKDLKWNYRKPDEALRVIKKIHMPEEINNTLSKAIAHIPKIYVHKQDDNNVMISQAERFANMLYFRGLTQTREIVIDHKSDHLEGILLFEVLRQATLASFHLMGVTFAGIMAITNTYLEYSKFVELDKPFYIQVIPCCKRDGGAMYCTFNIIQDSFS